MILGLVIGGALKIGGALLGAKADRKMRRARRQEIQATRLRNFVARRNAIRAARQKIALGQAAGRASGAGPESSALQSARSVGRTRIEEEFRISTQLDKFSAGAEKFRKDAGKLRTFANILGAAGGVAQSFDKLRTEDPEDTTTPGGPSPQPSPGPGPAPGEQAPEANVNKSLITGSQ